MDVPKHKEILLFADATIPKDDAAVMPTFPDETLYNPPSVNPAPPINVYEGALTVPAGDVITPVVPVIVIEVGVVMPPVKVESPLTTNVARVAVPETTNAPDKVVSPATIKPRVVDPVNVSCPESVVDPETVNAPTVATPLTPRVDRVVAPVTIKLPDAMLITPVSAPLPFVAITES